MKFRGGRGAPREQVSVWGVRAGLCSFRVSCGGDRRPQGLIPETTHILAVGYGAWGAGREGEVCFASVSRAGQDRDQVRGSISLRSEVRGA